LDGPAASPVASGDDADFFAEEAAARERKRQREVRYHTRQIPALRLLGMALLALVALADQRYIRRADSVAWLRYDWFTAGMAVYCLGSWLVLRRFFARCTALNLGTLFLIVDILWFAAAIWVSGADRSWLIFLLLVRVADQTNTSLRRVLVFLHLSVASYLLVLLAQRYLDGRPPWLALEAAKLSVIYVTGLYLATTARTAEVMRSRTSRAVHVAGKLIQQLRTQSEALEKARADAERAGRAKTAFLGNIGHELRTPLTGVLGLTELVLDTELDGEQREHLTAVRRCGGDLLRMVNDLLDLARLEAGGLKLHDEPLELGALLHDLADELRAAAEAKGLALAVTCDVPVRLRGDGARLRQILALLGHNAVKFTARGQVTLAARLVGLQAQRAELELSVADTGIGLHRDKQAMIFDAFSQVEESAQRKHGGAGLGLALVGRLARLMNARVWVESEPGQGARFFFAVALPIETSGAGVPLAGGLRATPGDDRADRSPAGS
jgi:signal transduction histidine kinase